MLEKAGQTSGGSGRSRNQTFDDVAGVNTWQSCQAFVPLGTMEESQTFCNLHHLLPFCLHLIVNIALFMFCDVSACAGGLREIKENYISSDSPRGSRVPSRVVVALI